MARKKAVIQAEWDKAQLALDNALKDPGGVTDAIVKDVQTKYAKWEKLLIEAVEKVKKWDGEQPSDRQVFQMYVNTQNTKMKPLYEKKVESLENALKATTDLVSTMKLAAEDIGKTTQKIENSRNAIKAKNSALAIAELGIATTRVKKNILPYATLTGVKKLAKNEATIKKCDVKNIDINQATIQSSLKLLAKAYVEIPKEIEELEGVIDELVEELGKAEATSTNSDPAYKKTLNAVKVGFKKVADDTKSSNGQCKKIYAEIDKLVNLADSITQMQVVAYTKKIMQGLQALSTEFRKGEKHVQDTIRTKDSTYVKMAEEGGLTKEDRIKNLKPFEDRAFMLNTSSGDLFNSAKVNVKDALESVADRFNSEEIRSVANQIK